MWRLGQLYNLILKRGEALLYKREFRRKLTNISQFILGVGFGFRIVNSLVRFLDAHPPIDLVDPATDFELDLAEAEIDEPVEGPLAGRIVIGLGLIPAEHLNGRVAGHPVFFPDTLMRVHVDSPHLHNSIQYFGCFFEFGC